MLAARFVVLLLGLGLPLGKPRLPPLLALLAPPSPRGAARVETGATSVMGGLHVHWEMLPGQRLRRQEEQEEQEQEEQQQEELQHQQEQKQQQQQQQQQQQGKQQREHLQEQQQQEW